jgi:hypothetical protein
LGLLKKIQGLFSKSYSTQRHSENTAESNNDFTYHYNNTGKFIYEEDGFTFQFDTGPEKIKWNEIVRLTAYKEDLMTFDEMRMDIFYNDRQFTITEETPGWFQFILKTKSVFPTIPEAWDIEIIFPAFAPNFTVLYERGLP